MSALKRPQAHGAGPGMSGSMLGTVTGVDGDYAQVAMDLGSTERVSVKYLRGKSFRPAAGERWLFDCAYGIRWQFAMYLGPQDATNPTGWVTAALNGSWAHYSAPGTWTSGSGLYSPVSYRLDVDGLVRLRGTAAGPSVSTSDAAGPVAADVFQLPAWARPDTAGQLLFGTASGQLKVFPDGFCRAVTGTPSKISLDGITFTVA